MVDEQIKKLDELATIRVKELLESIGYNIIYIELVSNYYSRKWKIIGKNLPSLSSNGASFNRKLGTVGLCLGYKTRDKEGFEGIPTWVIAINYNE